MDDFCIVFQINFSAYFIMSISNPLTDPRTREEEFLQLTQQQLLKAIAEEQEKIKRKDAVRNVESRIDDDDEPLNTEPVA